MHTPPIYKPAVAYELVSMDSPQGLLMTARQETSTHRRGIPVCQPIGLFINWCRAEVPKKSPLNEGVLAAGWLLIKLRLYLICTQASCRQGTAGNAMVRPRPGAGAMGSEREAKPRLQVAKQRRQWHHKETQAGGGVSHHGGIGGSKFGMTIKTVGLRE